MVRQVKIDKMTLHKYILWFIGHQKLVSAHKSITKEKLEFRKKEDGKATKEEIFGWLKMVYYPNFPSMRTIQRRIRELLDVKRPLIKLSGSIKRRAFYYRKEKGKNTSRGKGGTYSLTEAGKDEYSRMNMYLDMLRKADLHPDIPAIFGETLDKKTGKPLYVDSFIRIKDPLEKEVIMKARRSKWAQTHDLEFRTTIAGLQKWGLLMYCKAITDSRLRLVFKELASKDFLIPMLDSLPNHIKDMFIRADNL